MQTTHEPLDPPLVVACAIGDTRQEMNTGCGRWDSSRVQPRDRSTMRIANERPSRRKEIRIFAGVLVATAVVVGVLLFLDKRRDTASAAEARIEAGSGEKLLAIFQKDGRR